MLDQQRLTQIISITALLFSGASLTLAILGYRRGSVGLRVRIDYHVRAHYEEGIVIDRNYRIRALNDRSTTVEVRSIQFQGSYDPYGPRYMAGGPIKNLPRTISGFHSAEWSVGAEAINKAISSQKGRESDSIRAVLTTGSGHRIKSNWLEVGPPDSLVSSAEGILQ